MKRLSTEELKQIDFFSDCAEQALGPLNLKCARIDTKVHMDLNYSIDDERCWYLIEEGSYRVYGKSELPVKNANGMYLMCLRSSKHVALGEFELSDIAPPLHPNTQCIWPGSVVAIPNKQFKQVLKTSPKLYRKLFESVVAKLASDRKRIEAMQLVSKPPPQLSANVAQALYCIAIDLEREKTGRIKGILELEDLGAYMSAEKTPDNFEKKLNHLGEMGLIEYSEGNITIPDIDELAEHVRKLKKRRPAKKIA
ncbi:MAG TPA: hypothetical protein VGO50_20430 [Pyrinomonadaceae bacterium]|jgi:CRP-like cAMP-binding protein|nr:hypothetical protein [Pyrinomonadaceae bacterium]